MVNKDHQMRIEARRTSSGKDVAVQMDVVVVENSTNVVFVHRNGGPTSVAGVLAAALGARVGVAFWSVSMDFKVLDGADFVTIST